MAGLLRRLGGLCARHGLLVVGAWGLLLAQRFPPQQNGVNPIGLHGRTAFAPVQGEASAWIDLYWLPLGAGDRLVRGNGRAYEWWTSLRERRAALGLYHCALMVHHGGVGYAVEMGPAWNTPSDRSGVVCEGPVGTRWLGRFALFRYEVRCWPGGTIADVAEAVESPVRTTEDPLRVAAVLRVIPEVPALTWGRDEIGAGDMWNSNSLVSWALARGGHDMEAITPPANSRLPGWAAGLALARRQVTDVSSGP